MGTALGTFAHSSLASESRTAMSRHHKTTIRHAPVSPTFKADRAIGLVVLVTFFVLALEVDLHAANGPKLLFQNDSVLVLDRASTMTLAPSEQKPSAYIDFSKITLGDLKKEETEIINITAGFLQNRFNLTATRAGSDYLILVRTNDRLDRATRNRMKSPSNTLITILICKLSNSGVIATYESDCRNTDFNFFSDDPATTKLQASLDFWWKSVSPK